MKSSEECFQAFVKLKSELHKYPLDSQTEADTRARLVSRILHDVLDWPPENVNREEAAHPGFMDYVLLTIRRVAVLEAKRSGDTFALPADVPKSRNFTLGGILRTVPNLSLYIDQAARYCFLNGIEYAIVSNGLQFVVFRAVRNDGIHIGQGRVIVFGGFDDIERRFVEFWSLLAKYNVEANSLQRAFEPLNTAIFQYKRIAEEIHRYNERVSRNSLSAALEPLIGEYLGEITDDASRDKLKNFFVKNAPLAAALNAVEQRISLHLSETVRRTADVVEPTGPEGLRSGVRRRIFSHVALPPKGNVLLLLGRVGSGKTTFINHFMRVELRDLFAKHVLALFDFRLLEKNGDVNKFFYQGLQDALSKSDPFRNLSPKQLRQVYAAEIHELTKGPLAYVEKTNKKLYEEKIAEFLMKQFMEFDVHYVKVLRHLATKENVRSVLIFDNADQHDFELQQEVFRLAHTIAGKCLAMAIVPMWEETYLRSKQGGALAAYPASAYSIPPTSVVAIINRRLEAMVSDLGKDGHLARELVGGAAPHGDIIDFLSLIRTSIFYQGRRVRLFLECLAMGNLRKALDLFEQFLTSGHTDANKILGNVRAGSGYLVPLHEFIKSIGLGDSRYYHGDLSPLLNLYAISDEARPSHFTKIRLLAYLAHHRHHSSLFGLGFVRTDIIRQEFGRIGTSEPDIEESLRILAQKALVENDTYEIGRVGSSYRITVAGRYYLKYLAVRFSYLDLVLQDTPIADANAFATISGLIDSRDLEDRFRRVGTFLDYLLNEEAREHGAIQSTSDSITLRRRLVAEMVPEFQSEEAYIRGRAHGRARRVASAATPYETLSDPLSDDPESAGEA